MLSNLPDDILLTVLDRLDVRDAARTGVLSTRWSQLPAMLSRLVINVWDFRPPGVSDFREDEFARTNAAAIEATKSMLERRDSTRNIIHQLSVTFFLRESDPISIGHTVAQAMATHKVGMAGFIVLTKKEPIGCDGRDLIDYGRQFMLFFDACPDAFAGITCLHLENLRFGESDISNVLVTCKRLKDLRFLNCDSEGVTTLQMEHSQLSELSIVDCRLGKVMLNWLPQLARMTFEGWIAFHYALSVVYAPLLEVVNLTNVGLSWHKMIELSKFLRGTSVRDLKLGFKSEKIWVQPECLTKSPSSVFCQLRFLNLDDIPEGYNLTWTLFVLKAAPSLKELWMTVWDHLCKMETDEEKRRAHLATLTIFGFESEEYMVSYVRRVMEAAVNLEEVFLYHRLACGKCRANPNTLKRIRYPWTKRQRSSVKKRITDGVDSFAIIRFPTNSVRGDHIAKKKYP
ncbi:hypothetical protein BRADI_4g02960v3 [Brachypodium distachyon]|uniref:F-box domain-containing protein n=1 Tax=Brachypodium distachyon TaxID=15368 RepID=A0A0Q3PAG4_BRADI|nr:hypothetical protein BRADI_4g02960v3 [Brachypodium distachyon]